MTAPAVDLRKLARRQRWLIWLLLGAFLVQCAPPFLLTSVRGTNWPVAFMLLGVLHLVLWISLMVGTVLLVLAQGTHWLVAGLVAVLMLVPVGNFLVLLIVSTSVNRTFRRAGVRVRLTGVDKTELERALDPMLCRYCGYNLTGNVSGVCPECGQLSPRWPCRWCNEIVEASPGMDCPKCLRPIG